MVIKKIKHKDATGNLHEYDIGAEAKNVTQDKDRQFVTAEEKEAWNKKQDGDGDVSSLSVKFQQASTRSNIKTGEKLNVIFGKIAKWFADFKSHVFLDLVQNATTKDTTRAVSAAVAAELQKQIDSLNSALTVKREEKTVSTFLPPTILYRYGKIVMFRCAGMPQKDMQPNVDYQIGTIPEGFRPIVNTYEYKKYNANRECRVVINNDGTASIRFFDDVATTVGININMTYIAE